MLQNSIFYYPYASFDDPKLPLLKTAALYFDKIYVLDPLKANIPQGNARNEITKALKLLSNEDENKRILEIVDPADTLKKYNDKIITEIKKDARDPEFIDLCKKSGKKEWELALAKVPINTEEDDELQTLMGDVSTSIEQPPYDKNTWFTEYYGGDGTIEYRGRRFSVHVGESIMINHALVGGLLVSQATPITDHPLHNSVLHLKIRRILESSEFSELREALEDKTKQLSHKMKSDYLSATLLRDLDLAIIPSELPFEEILRFRYEHSKDLESARKRVGWLAREIKERPWSKDFFDEIDTVTIPRVNEELEACKVTLDSWLERNKSNLRRLGKIGALTAGIATISMTILPDLSIGELISGGVSAAVGLGYDTITERRRRNGGEGNNGLAYFMKVRSQAYKKKEHSWKSW